MHLVRQAGRGVARCMGVRRERRGGASERFRLGALRARTGRSADRGKVRGPLQSSPGAEGARRTRRSSVPSLAFAGCVIGQNILGATDLRNRLVEAWGNPEAWKTGVDGFISKFPNARP